tara:strand:- start:54 stop:443 length:390 start_codon:yes stop_codon:yes gene_type:complete
MKKMLYFADGTAGANATTEAALISVDMVKSMEPISGTVSNIYLNAEVQANHRDDVSTRDDSAGKIYYEYIAITHTADKFKEVAQAITQAMNTGPHTDGFIVIADALNSVFCSSLITDCQLKYVDTDTAV